MRAHHYAWRGGPVNWTSSDPHPKDSPEYLAAYSSVGTRGDRAQGLFPGNNLKYLDTPEFNALAPRTPKGTQI